MSKLGEGNFNKIFLLKMDDAEVVARIPHPNAGPPHFTTASEVATLFFLRNHLKINVPKVFGWSSNASSTPVAAEYILMERASGVELSVMLTARGF
jgi:aminoglycoside phosphotransferase (APT) family kinase protein